MFSRRSRLPLPTAVAVLLAFAGAAVAEDPPRSPPAPDLDRLTDADFPAIFAALQPPKVEPWKSIPWHVSLVEAARQAEKEGKPVFLWQADGWPLGCG
jgi:hypothetical protein